MLDLLGDFLTSFLLLVMQTFTSSQMFALTFFGARSSVRLFAVACSRVQWCVVHMYPEGL